MKDLLTEEPVQEVALKRFKTYFSQTEPLIELYKNRGWLVEIDASMSIDEIYKELTGAIKENVHS